MVLSVGAMVGLWGMFAVGGILFVDGGGAMQGFEQQPDHVDPGGCVPRTVGIAKFVSSTTVESLDMEWKGCGRLRFLVDDGAGAWVWS